MAPQIAQPAKCKLQAAQHEQVNCHNPFNARNIALKSIPHERQDGIHNTRVQSGHERTGANSGQDIPLTIYTLFHKELDTS